MRKAHGVRHLPPQRWIGASLLLVGLLGGPVAAPEHETTSVARGIVRAASERDFPPLALVGPGGAPDGFSVELFEAVASVMHLDYVIEVGSFGDIKSNLAEGRSDVLLNLAWSEERARTADFSVPHTRVNGAVFVRRGDGRIRSEADLPGHSIGVLRGDLAHDWALAQGWAPQITATNTIEEAMRLVAAGRVDCVLVARLVGIVTLRTLGIESVVAAGAPISGFAQKFSFAVRKGDTELLAKLNEGLAIVTADGSFEALQDKWFGPFEPPKVRVEQVIRYALPAVFVGLALLVGLSRRVIRVRTRELAEANASLEAEVSVRRRVEDELRHSLSLEEATLEATEDGILVVDREGRIERFNGKFARMWSIPSSLLERRDDRPVLALALDQLVDPSGALDNVRRLHAQPEAASFDVLRLKDGRIIERSSQAQRVDGVLVGRVWSFRDVTERRRAEERFRELAETIDDVFWMGDPARRRILYASPGFERVFGRSPALLFESTEAFLDMVHPDDRPAVLEALGRLRHGEPTSTEFRVVWPDGSLHWLWNRSFPVWDDQGALLRVNGITADVTERRQAEAERQLFERRLQEMQRLESLGLLAGGIAHDFNNLLTGILGNASIARDELPEGSPLQEPLEQVESIALRAAELCRQMLTYAGKGAFSEARLDLNVVIEDTLQLLRLSVGRRVVLRWEPAKGLPSVRGDASQIQQVLMNLVINAAEALGERSGQVLVSTGVVRIDGLDLADSRPATDLPEGECVFVDVEDEGCGMDAATRERIFDPFFTTKFTGRGLGLAAVLGIVRRHRGALQVKSVPGRGSRFRMLLPVVEGEPERREDRALPPAARGHGLVLVVDDEETVRSLVARVLEGAGYEVLLAADGREGIDRFRADQERLAAVVLDLTMPRLDGRTAFYEMRAVRAHLPVLVMTGYDEKETIGRFDGAGPMALLHKPFQPSELLRSLGLILGRG